MKAAVLAASSLFLLLIIPHYAMAGEPTDVIRQNADKVLAYLDSPEWKKMRKEDQRQALRSIIEGIFDEHQLSKRALGQNWQRLSPEQRQEFIKLFTELQEINFVDHLQSFTNELIRYEGENIKGEKALVHTKIVFPTSGDEVPIDYSLHKTPDGWKIYDINAEGVDMVENYRSQLKDILAVNDPATLIERLRAKVREESQGLSK